MKLAAWLVLGAAASLAGTGAPAQMIFRCGGNSYSNAPCPGGKVLEATSPTTAAERAEARQVAIRARRLADDMARERRAEEARIHPATAGSFSPVPAASAASAPEKKTAKKKPKKPHAASGVDGGDFIAVAPKARKQPG